jgi:hypothetical protein
MATWWLAKSGKLLMLLAGLVVILDLVGRERLQGIQERAELRHDLSKELRRLYEHYDVIDELAGAIRGEVIFSGPVFSSTDGIQGAIIRGYERSKSPPAAIPPLFSLADVKEFVTRTTMFSYVTQEYRVRIRLDSLVNVALARRLSSFGLTLLGRRGDGEPVKWLALILFIAGSLLDLIFG